MNSTKGITDKEAENAYLSWQREPPIGCTFARRIARNPTAYQRRVEVVRGAVATTVATALDGAVAAAVQDTNVAAVAVLLPDITTIQDLAGTVLALATASPPWAVNRSLLPQTAVGPMVAFHVSREIPFNSATCPSEALVLGNFKEFPNTRRSPITAMELFVGIPMSHDPKSGEPSTKANLAHLTLPFPSRNAFSVAWSSAEKGRAESLGVPLRVAAKDDLRAKAKVSFAIPSAVAVQLGCHP